LLRSGSCASSGCSDRKSAATPGLRSRRSWTVETRTDAALALYFSFDFISSSRSACSTRSRSTVRRRGRAVGDQSRRGADRPDRYCPAILHPGDAMVCRYWTRPIRWATTHRSDRRAVRAPRKPIAGNAEAMDVLLSLWRESRASAITKPLRGHRRFRTQSCRGPAASRQDFDRLSLSMMSRGSPERIGP